MNLDVPTEREETLDVDDATAFMHQQERVDDDLAGKKSHRYMGPYGECILYVSHVCVIYPILYNAKILHVHNAKNS